MGDQLPTALNDIESALHDGDGTKIIHVKDNVGVTLQWSSISRSVNVDAETNDDAGG
jgi:hypothetical protein